MTVRRRAAFAAMFGLGLAALGGCVIRDDDDDDGDGSYRGGYRAGRRAQRRQYRQRRRRRYY